MDSPQLTFVMPTEEDIKKVYYAIVRVKANNEDTFINDGGKRAYMSKNDKTGASLAFWQCAYENKEYAD